MISFTSIKTSIFFWLQKEGNIKSHIDLSAICKPFW
uniref:Uncharacterized protein n=1 Tax=Rhizophora mucronata TaxID=61149 RepID=A0A2P2KS85_RHIMU